MMPITAGELASAVGGTLSGNPDLVLTGSVETDSRLVQPGSIFFAMPGEVTDGHRFIDSAVAAGAALVVCEREVQTSVPTVVVPRGVVALGDLARHVVAKARSEQELTVVAVTGSNGKTTTKNMLHAILAEHGPTVSPEKSFNNEVGGPMTMLRVAPDTRYLVLEMGASYVGDIERLVGMARPDIGIVLKVGLAHAGEFGGPERIFQAKSEMVTELLPSDVAVLNWDDERVRSMADLTKARVRFFGTEAPVSTGALAAADIETHLEGTRFTLHFEDAGEPLPVRLRILGEHHVMNALAALSVARELGLDLARAALALERMPRAERWRMELLDGPRGAIIINDAYNSSPDSARAALQTLAHLGRVSGRRTTAVLGEMAELGELSVPEHDRLGRLVVRYGIDRLIAVGEPARAAHIAAEAESSFGQDTHWVPDAEAAGELLTELGVDDLVLVKSSLAAGLKDFGDALGGVEAE